MWTFLYACIITIIVTFYILNYYYYYIFHYNLLHVIYERDENGTGQKEMVPDWGGLHPAVAEMMMIYERHIIIFNK